MAAGAEECNGGSIYPIATLRDDTEVALEQNLKTGYTTAMM